MRSLSYLFFRTAAAYPLSTLDGFAASNADVSRNPPRTIRRAPVGHVNQIPQDSGVGAVIIHPDQLGNSGIRMRNDLTISILRRRLSSSLSRRGFRRASLVGNSRTHYLSRLPVSFPQSRGRLAWPDVQGRASCVEPVPGGRRVIRTRGTRGLRTKQVDAGAAVIPRYVSLS